jgi:hypothetical protein
MRAADGLKACQMIPPAPDGAVRHRPKSTAFRLARRSLKATRTCAATLFAKGLAAMGADSPPCDQDAPKVTPAVWPRSSLTSHRGGIPR